MTAEEREAKLRRTLRVLIGFVFTGAGFAYLFGPDMWHSSGNFSILLSLGIPIEVWAVVFAVGGVLLMANIGRWNWLAYLVLTLSALFWSFCSFATLFTGTAQSGGAPFFLFGMAGHAFLGLYFTYLDRVEQREIPR